MIPWEAGSEFVILSTKKQVAFRIVLLSLQPALEPSVAGHGSRSALLACLLSLPDIGQLEAEAPCPVQRFEHPRRLQEEDWNVLLLSIAGLLPTFHAFLSVPMRISGGTARGIPLKVPAGDAVRPATDGMRQSVFSSLAARIPGARFFDLFAGSGAYGLEALSRGAAGGVFVEKSPKAAACLRQNIDAVCKSLSRKPADAATVFAMDVFTAPLSTAPAPELVFIDPPYDLIPELGPRLLIKLHELLVSVEDPIIVFEMPGEQTIESPSWTCVKRLGKGVRQPTVAFYRRASIAAAQ